MKKYRTVFALSLALSVTSVLSNPAMSQTGTQNTPPEEFKPSGRFSMQFIGDYFYQIASDTAARRGGQYYSGNPKDYQAFDIRRVYLGYDYDFTKQVSGQVLLAHENGSSSGDIIIDQNRGLYIKAANIRWKNILPNATLIFGQQGTAAFALSEQLWGYRSIEKVVMDARGLAGSNDLGIQLTGGIDNSSTLGYSLMISNGRGPKTENDKYKKYALELNTKLADNKVVLEVYGDLMDNALGRTTTLKGLAAVQFEPITAGVEYAMQTNSFIAPTGVNQTPGALSIFAHGYIAPKTLNWFARYDMWNPDSKIDASGYKENFITAGLDWIPNDDANVHVMPNIWVNTYSPKGSIPDPDADLVGRLTFFYKF